MSKTNPINPFAQQKSESDTSNESYILITPARNEEVYIEKTIQAVISQTVLPRKWVIVSDSSTDRTDAIVEDYATQYNFIQHVRISHHSQRHFGSKVCAIRAGYEHLRDEEYDFIGNLDADISFDSDYYEKILKLFCAEPALGIAGGIIWELCDGHFKHLSYSLNSVAGAVQLFRRQCYEEIGGYIPIKEGGEDAVAEAMVRMFGWKVKTFSEISVYHHRQIGLAKSTILGARFRSGIMDNLIGAHPIFIMVKCIDRFRQKPYVVGGLLTMCGYLWSIIRRDPRPVSDEFVKYIRHEQIRRMGLALSNILKHKLTWRVEPRHIS